MPITWSRIAPSDAFIDQFELPAEDSTSLSPVVNGWSSLPGYSDPRSAPSPAQATIAAVATASSPLTGPALALNVSAAANQFGMTGAGIRIGILSDSFNVHGGYAADVADGFLDPGVTVLKEGPVSGNDEGRAMAEVIHQIAPDAQIFFYTAFDGEADFAKGIASLAAAGAQIIVDDVTYLDEPFFQDNGLVQKAAEQAVAGGVSYFTAAGNEGTNYYQHAFQGIQTDLSGLSGSMLAMNFGNASNPQTLQTLTIASGSSIKLDLQWDQPFGNAVNSLGMVLYDDSGDIVGYAMRNVVGGNPDQILQFTNTSATTDFQLAIVANGGSTAPGLFKYIAYGKGLQIDDASAGSGAGSLFGHETAAGVNTVGAIDWSQVGSIPQVESFSSVGVGSLLFDASGNRLAQPQVSGQVDFVAPDGGNTSVFGTFSGTSAAAPAAAATAALVLQENATLTPAQVSAILVQSTVPVSGPIGSAGAGLIQADTAVFLASDTVTQQSAAGTLPPPSTIATNLPTVAGSAGTTLVASVNSLPSFTDALHDIGRDPTAQGDLALAVPSVPAFAGAIPTQILSASASLPPLHAGVGMSDLFVSLDPSRV